MAKNELEHLPTADLIPYARNARLHSDAQIAKIAGSLREFGFCNPVLIDSQDGIIAGHGRVLAALKLGMETVPCLRLDHLSDIQRRAYILADNRLALDASWDEAMLGLELSALEMDGFDLDLVGFDAGELEVFLDGNSEPGEAGADTEPEIDRAEELREKWGVETGQLWQLGEHRLLCGDSTNAEDVTRVNGNENCLNLVFDPPWDLEVPTPVGYSSVLAFGDGYTLKNIMARFGECAWVFVWDCVSSWYTPNRPLRRMKLCVWFGDIENYNFNGAHYGDAGERREVFNSRGSYTFIPDPRGKHLSDLFVSPITKLHSESDHSHSKPMEWVSMLIGNCTEGAVFDPYLGSGTTLIACENLGRRCRAIEISPAYVAVALERWHQHTGKMPELIDA